VLQTVNGIAISPSLYKTLPFDVHKDFIAVRASMPQSRPRRKPARARRDCLAGRSPVTWMPPLPSRPSTDSCAMPRRLLPCLLLLCAWPALARALEPVRVADGVYAFIGALGEAAADNGGNIGNSGFIVGRTGVIVIDTGISYRHGQAILDAIHRVSDKPVQLVIVTHAVQEFLFGNAAFAELGTPMLTHTRSAELMRQRCDHCLANLHKILGEHTMAGTRLVVPERTVDRSTTLEVAGRKLELLHFGWAATPGDLAVLDQSSGTLFAGGLVSVGRIPEIRDCDFEGWLQVLEQLQRLSPSHVVPGFGQPGGPEALAATGTYLRALDAKVKDLYARSSSLLESVENADLPDYEGWLMYSVLHRRNAQHRYLQLETRDLGGDPRSVALPQQ